MTINLTDDITMSKANNAFWGCEKTPSLDRLYAAASVFEAAANAQADARVAEAIAHSHANLPSPAQRERIVKMLDERYRNSDNGPSEPTFVAGKRYRTRGAGIAEVLETNSAGVKVQYAGGTPFWAGVKLWVNHSGALDSSLPTSFDLLPDAIPDPAPEAQPAMTDYDLGGKLIAAYWGGGGNCVHGYTELARRARELLTDALVIANLDAMILELRAERDAWRDRALAAERQEDVVTCDFKIMAEAELKQTKAALGRVRIECEEHMRELPADQTYGGGVRQGLLMAACAAGFVVHPARELSVVWEGVK